MMVDILSYHAYSLGVKTFWFDEFVYLISYALLPGMNGSFFFFFNENATYINHKKPLQGNCTRKNGSSFNN